MVPLGECKGTVPKTTGECVVFRGRLVEGSGLVMEVVDPSIVFSMDSEPCRGDGWT